jgi:carbon monoxide dehydrogenase subunit G
MKLEQSFEVAAPLERVWEALIDIQRVAPCLPGATVTGRNDDGTYNGEFKVKIGPTSAAYAGKLAMEDVNPESHTATMQAQGTDRRGQGGAKATILSSLADIGDGLTRVEVITDYHITGRLARFGRGGMIEDISNRLLGDFAKCLQTSLAGGEGAASGAPGAEEPAPSPPDATPTGGPPPPPGAPPPPGGPPPPPAAAPPGEPRAGEPRAGEPQPPSEPTPPGEPPPLGESPPPPTDGQPRPGGPPPPQPGPEFEANEPIQGLSLVGSVLWGRAKRNPAPIAAVLVGFLLAFVLRRRFR